jgi:hypothetical protein
MFFIGGDFDAPIVALTRRFAPTSPHWGEVV